LIGIRLVSIGWRGLSVVRSYMLISQLYVDKPHMDRIEVLIGRDIE